MHPDLGVQRKVLVKSYRRYLDADHDWTMAVEQSLSWVQPRDRPQVSGLGEPGSRVRRLYEARERALQRLVAARDKLERARRRIEQRDRAPRRLLLLTP
ncbi:hypothetical protein [Defluviimonas salinarum]|uniref:Transposase n=1 Tax=Defluviimonas salinarum TaxID=2992147 RepID=A0ABT3JA75_9RHOB|nr:hypothetical protein [Defluviimonas salinarum]MCW3784575.1 hypothetical protein [Defluviimonas salinarum]